MLQMYLWQSCLDQCGAGRSGKNLESPALLLQVIYINFEREKYYCDLYYELGAYVWLVQRKAPVTKSSMRVSTLRRIVGFVIRHVCVRLPSHIPLSFGEVRHFNRPATTTNREASISFASSETTSTSCLQACTRSSSHQAKIYPLRNSSEVFVGIRPSFVS